MVDTLVTVSVAAYCTHDSALPGHASWLVATAGAMIGSVAAKATIAWWEKRRNRKPSE